MRLSSALAKRASYASQRELDKRIILIALAQPFPCSGSSWWSARSPPCYSPFASQVSTCMTVFISQVAVAWLSILLLPILPPRCPQLWVRLGWFIPYPPLYQSALARAKWTEAMHKMKRTLWFNSLSGCSYIVRQGILYGYDSEVKVLAWLMSPGKSWPIIDRYNSKGKKRGEKYARFQRIKIITVIRKKPGVIGTWAWDFTPSDTCLNRVVTLLLLFGFKSD